MAVKVAVKNAEMIIDTYNLVGKSEFQLMPEFRKAEIVRSTSQKGDYIKFYVWDAQKGQLVRKRRFIPAKYKTTAEKNAFLKDDVKRVNKLLKEGYHINAKVSKQQKEYEQLKRIKKQRKKEKKQITTALDAIITLREAKKYKDRGIETFKKEMRNFIIWGSKRRKPLVYISDITFEVIQDFQLYILTDLKNESKTCNNKIGVVSAFYSNCIDQGWISKKKNPFDKFDELPTNYGTKNIPYTDKEIADMKVFILNTDPYLWTIISFLYYTLIRPGELRDLKVKDIDLKQNVIRIWCEQSKVKKCDLLPIAPSLRKMILKMNLDNFHSDDFLFGSNEKPSSTQMGKNFMTKHFKKVKDHFEFSKDHTLYGFKHTACCKWYEAEKDIRKIQLMCRHSTITSTERYLKSMGLLTDDDAVSGIGEI